MQKPLALSIAACLGFSGCNVIHKSETWSQAVRVRPAETTRDPDPSNAYAAKLHEAFVAQGVEHKVVVYQYHYMTRRHEEAVGTRTAVIYRDDANPNYPWWLKDDRLNNPFWLPNGSLDKQVSFYIRRKAEVIEVKEYPASRSGKTTLAFAKAAPKLRKDAQSEPQRAVTRLTPVKKAPAPVVAHKPAPAQEAAKPRVIAKAPVATKPLAATKPAPRENAVKSPVIVKAPAPAPARHAPPAPVARGPVTAIKAPASIFSPKPSPKKEPAALEPVASRNTGGGSFWTLPAVLDPEQQPALTAPHDERLEKLFRAKHGTNYNRFSPADRRKMQQLQKGVAARE